MRVVIGGSRKIVTYEVLEDAVREALQQKNIRITTIISGGAEGVDALAELYAERHNIPIQVYAIERAEWERKGKAAGPLRNRLMASKADALIAVWDGKSKGTKSMIKEAERKHLRKYIHDLSKIKK